MTDDQLLRYGRHILLDEVGIEGQTRLLGAHALIIGLGGLGCTAALFLGSAGVGELTFLDPDVVDLSNLQRQIAHTTARIGQPKVRSAAQAIAELNPDVVLTPIQARADGPRLDALLGGANAPDVVLDCTDNFATRHSINAACVRHRIPLVSASAIRFDGQLAVFDARKPSSPCYACVFPRALEHADEACATLGVFAPLLGIMGSMQAAQALRLLIDGYSDAPGWLRMVNAQTMDVQAVRTPRVGNCAVCGGGVAA